MVKAMWRCFATGFLAEVSICLMSLRQCLPRCVRSNVSKACGKRKKRGDALFVIATHSPFVMAYPGAPLLHLTPFSLMERSFQQAEHFQVLREFYKDPEGFMNTIFDE